MYPVEREQCIGLKKGDLTQIFEQPDVIWKLTGNAFPVQVQAHIIREVLRRNLIHSLRRSTESEPPMQTIALNISSILFAGLKHVQPEHTVREESGV